MGSDKVSFSYTYDSRGVLLYVALVVWGFVGPIGVCEEETGRAVSGILGQAAVLCLPPRCLDVLHGYLL